MIKQGVEFFHALSELTDPFVARHSAPSRSNRDTLQWNSFSMSIGIISQKHKCLTRFP